MSERVRSQMRRFLVPLGAALVLLASGSHAAPGDRPGLFIMGVDGMDPVILQRLIDEGKMPHFKKFAEEGAFQSLGTANPPQSPVAWSNFVTGMNPGGHGVFDFMHRDKKNYAPLSSATKVSEEEVTALNLFGFVIPISGGDLENNRGGTPWWDYLHDAGVDVEVYRIPGNYPTPASDAKVLSGMGTTDLRGGFGTYTLYTDQVVARDKPKGDIQFVTVRDLDLDGTPDTVTSALKGPPDQLRLEPGQVPKDNQYINIGVTVHLDSESDTAVVEVGDEHVLIAEGEWSDWVEVNFDLAPMGLMPVSGIVRFYAKELRPGFQLYASPVNISPASPLAAITSPDDFVEELHDGVGFFYTQGMPEDNDALKDGVFSEDDYLKQVRLVQDDTNAMLNLALDRFEPGDASFVYFSDIDLQCHMLWRHADPKHQDAPPHPAYEAQVARGHELDIEGFYKDVDKALGHIQKRLPEGTTIMVMSDHGFQAYTRQLHLNAWLRENGYLVMKEGKRTGYTVTNDIDWSKTKAFGLGFNGLYLNVKGRESQGSVDPSEMDALMTQLTKDLEAYRDPKTGQRVVKKLFRATEAYSGPRTNEGPDMLVGYDAGFGASDESTLGEVTEAVIADNTSRWSGNHLMDPSVVPGVLLINRKLQSDGHDLTDLTATILSHYGIATPSDMVGKAIQ